MNSSLFYSEVDSMRFNRNIHRGMLQSIDSLFIKNYINNNSVDLLILRVPVTLSESLYKLNQLEREVILADTLVYYYADFKKYTPQTLKNNLHFKEVTLENTSVVQSMIPVVFENYTNHYTSNPSLNKNEITKGYVEWATGYVRQMDNTKISWIVYKDDVPIGFATCSEDQQKRECEGILYGVLPDYSGGGVYSDIIRFTQNYFLQKNAELMKVSTQIQNFAVQKVWSREGFALKEAFYTFHIVRNDSI